jgi:hypothetical protein
MSLYKDLRYKQGDKRDKNLTWTKVDAWFNQAIKRYKLITWPDQDHSYLDSEESQPLFIDIIVKITIIRAYANVQNKMVLTAEKLLECAKIMIDLLDKGEL